MGPWATGRLTPGTAVLHRKALRLVIHAWCKPEWVDCRTEFKFILALYPGKTNQKKKKKKNSGSLGASREFLKLCKPFPLFPYHFTPPLIRHLLQIVGVKQYSKPEKKKGAGKLTKSNFYAKFYFSKVTLVVSHSPFQIFLRSFPSLQLSFHWCLWKAHSTYALGRLGVIAQVSLRNRYMF